MTYIYKINQDVNVSTQILSAGVLKKEFGITLFIYKNGDNLTVNRTGRYADFDQVASAFNETSEVYKASGKYFDNRYGIPKNFIAGVWFDQATNGFLLSGKEPNLSEIKVINAGSFDINIDGVVKNIVGLDFSTVTTFSDIATILERAISGVTVTYSGTDKKFIIKSNTTGSTSIVNGVTITATSTALKIASDEGAITVVGRDTETITNALNEIEASDSSFYFITTETSIYDTNEQIDIKDWVAAKGSVTPYHFQAGFSDIMALVQNETSSIAAQLFAEGVDRVSGNWCLDNTNSVNYLPVSISSVFSTVNFSGSNSTITGKFKELNGILPANLLPTELTELERKRVNIALPITNDIRYGQGVTFNQSVYTDTIYGVDWLNNSIKVDTFNILLTSNKISQTESGMGILKANIKDSLDHGVTNGLIAGEGKFSTTTTAQIKATIRQDDFTGEVSPGYIIYSIPMVEQSQSDRNLRKSTQIYTWVKLAGAIHNGEVMIVLEN